jgi:UDP-N-acetylmuramoyl-tripeptide--D-alanyl-D-alanine ligase
MTIDHLYDIFRKFPLVCTDSRRVTGNSIFFALRGENYNGNLYSQMALNNGAAYAVVDDSGVVINDHFILVEDVMTSLQQLASLHRKTLGIPIIAITGTNGKTTTKELTAAVLGTKFNVEYTRGNLNNHIGVPLTLLTMSEKTEIGVVEMGANHPGEIDFLCRIADPGYGLVTNMGKAHLEGFGNFEGVVKTKSELYRYLGSQRGTVFINGDNPLLLEAAGSQKTMISYGTCETCWLRGVIINEPPFLNLTILDNQAGTTVKTSLIGNYNFENALAAAAVGRYFGIETEKIISALENYTPSNNRSQLMVKGTNTIIMDAYNANPSSMMASLSNFLQMDESAKVVILGDMLELGDDSLAEHQKIIDIVSGRKNLTLFLVGKNFMQTVKPENCRSFFELAELMDWLSNHPVTDSSILIKGSHGIRLDKVIASFS